MTQPARHFSLRSGSAVGAGPAWSQWNGQSDAGPDRTVAACAGGASTEVIGCWNGVEAGDEIAVDQSDGLTDKGLRLVADRGMARVEQIRDRPFRTDVPVEVITRTAYQQQRAESATAETFNRWNDQVWKALFVIGDDESAADALDATFGGAVAEFYSPTADQITIVTDGGSDTQIGPSTLIHELGAVQRRLLELGGRGPENATGADNTRASGATEQSQPESSTDDAGPGFGVTVTATALIGTVVAARHHNRPRS